VERNTAPINGIGEEHCTYKREWRGTLHLKTEVERNTAPINWSGEEPCTYKRE
jgi:hypothetical protein